MRHGGGTDSYRSDITTVRKKLLCEANFPEFESLCAAYFLEGLTEMQTRFIPPNALWLLLPPIALYALDSGLTLYGQSDEYWAGNYADVNEMSPSFNYYLSVHPLVAGAAFLLWIFLFSAVILLLPEILAMMLSVAIVIGHMVGATSWLAFRLESYQACSLLFLVTAVVIVFSFKRGQNNDGRAAIDWGRTGLPEWTRWVLIAGLAALPVWWFLVPR